MANAKLRPGAHERGNVEARRKRERKRIGRRTKKCGFRVGRRCSLEWGGEKCCHSGREKKGVNVRVKRKRKLQREVDKVRQGKRRERPRSSGKRSLVVQHKTWARNSDENQVRELATSTLVERGGGKTKTTALHPTRLKKGRGSKNIPTNHSLQGMGRNSGADKKTGKGGKRAGPFSQKYTLNKGATRKEKVGMRANTKTNTSCKVVNTQ